MVESNNVLTVVTKYSTLMAVIFGFTQGSILRTLLSNIFLVHIFFIINNVDIANYADDNGQKFVCSNIPGQSSWSKIKEFRKIRQG